MSHTATPPQPAPLARSDLVFLDRLRELNRQVLYSTAAAPLAWLLVAYLMSQVIPLPRVGLWIALMAGAEGACFALTLMFRRANPGIAQAPNWARLHGLAALASGAAWGSSTLLLWPQSNLEYQQILLLALCGVTAAGAISNAAMRRASIGLVLPMWLIAIARLIHEGTPLHLALAGLCAVFVVMMITVSQQVTRTLTSSIVLRYENLELVEQLRQAKLVAEDANQTKSVFLAAASHDLRQPVVSTGLLLGTLDHLIQQPEPDTHALAQVISQSRRSLAKLNTLIHALLDISRLDAKAAPPALSNVNVAQLLTELADDFRDAANAQNLDLRLRLPPGQAECLSEPIALHRLMGNLIENAIRHHHTTRRKGVVLISCRQHDSLLLLEVWDNGPGIATDAQAAIFTEFYQLGHGSQDRGLGLGLAIVLRLATQLNHRVRVSSQAGRGSRFSVEVALATRPMATKNMPAICARATN